MKPKKFNNKLILNKKTISNLNQGTMDEVRGGVKTNYTCYPRTFCNTVDMSCGVTQCDTCYHTCPPTWCDTECGC